MERNEEELASDPVTHGGEGDPLGGGVADMDDTEGVTEGKPDQDTMEVGDEDAQN